MWLSLTSKILTKDLYQKKNNEHPGICFVCWRGGEDISHIFMKCRFSLQFCNKIEWWLGKKDIWKYESVEVGLKIWFSWEYLNNYRAIIFLTSWKLWNYRNVVYFENCPSHSTQVSTAMCTFDKYLKEYSNFKINRYKTHMRYNAYAFYIAYVL